ncbi:MAG: response regulator [Betaproteobacteria bacterium]|nr:response regulator [Betaproteobacteria bacterium]
MRILIIDDVQINITILQHLIRKIPGCESVAFTNPLLAIDWCRCNEPDLVVVDYMMPEMDGIQFTREFRSLENYEVIPILMVTANDEISVRHDALNSGITDFLIKPLDNIEFMARTKNMLELRKSHKRITDRAEWLAEEVHKATTEILARERETIFCLSRAAEYRDPETGAHILRMAHYSKHIARVLGLTLDQQELLLEAAPMHDIGKVGIPDSILLKPGKLTVEEFTIMKQHPVIGFEVLSTGNSQMLKAAATIALSHHEKFDGSGYPNGLSGNDIPLYGRIVAVADVFDALTSERPYKKAWTIERAKQLICNSAGQHFDMTCVNAFFSDFDEVLRIKNSFVDDQ